MRNKLPNELRGELYCRVAGIIDKIEEGGLEYNYALNGFQAVFEGRGFLPPELPKLEPVANSIIRFKCSVYPDWVEKVLHPELEWVGPAEYNISQVKQWLHGDQKGGRSVKGQVIYEYLKEKKMLESCLGLSELLAIQSKGIDFFRQHFAGKSVFGWKSVVQRRDGRLLVPFLCEIGDEVVLYWSGLGREWYSRSPALRLKVS